MKEIVLAFLIVALLAANSLTAQPINVTPTNKSVTLLRGGPGVFGYPRANGKSHSGVDIVANQSNADKMTYAVRAVAAGKIAYARINDSQTSGYGFTIIIDHGDNHYTLYAHLATNATKALNPTIGKNVAQNEVIGFMADLTNNERSSGNVASCVVAPFDKIQVHFEHILAPSGRTSTAGIDVIKAGGSLADPTAELKALGYLEFPPPASAPACPPTLPAES